MLISAWILITVIVISIFLPDILSTAMHIGIALVVVVGILFALKMVLKARKERLRLQLETQKITPAGSQNSNTPATTEQSSVSDDKMNIF